MVVVPLLWPTALAIIFTVVLAAVNRACCRGIRHPILAAIFTIVLMPPLQLHLDRKGRKPFSWSIGSAAFGSKVRFAR